MRTSMQSTKVRPRSMPLQPSKEKRQNFSPVRLGVSDDLRETLISVVRIVTEQGVFPHGSEFARYPTPVGIQHLLFGIQQYCIDRSLIEEEGTLEPHPSPQSDAWARLARAVIEAQKTAEANNL